MKRLIQDESLEGQDRELAHLFRTAVPFGVDPFRKRRVLVRLQRGPGRRSGHFWLRPAIVAALLLSGTAAAALGHRYLARDSGSLGLSGAPSTTLASAQKPAPVVSEPSLRVAEVETASAHAAVVAAPAAEPVSAPRIAVKGSLRFRPESGEDATRVVEAIQALRTERDPARAQGLLDDYLKSHPRGVLSGDALALSIEAASAQHDPRAADYARRYLANFPNGKYRALAQRALAKQR